jgi:hypothetical protein
LANQFEAYVPNALQSLMGAEQSYKDARAGRAEEQKRLALQQAGQSLQNGGDTRSAIGQLFGAGELQGASVLASLGKTDLTDEIKEYNLSKSQGYKGSFTDWKTGLKLAGSTKVNNNTVVNSGEKSYDQKVGGDYGETFVNLNKEARNSVGAINNLNLMENLTKHPDFYSGSGGEIVTQAKKLATSLGISDADKAAPNELFKKISQKSVLDSAGGSLGTGFSNADRMFLEGTVPNIENTPEGNRQIIGIARTVEKRKQEIAQLARDYAGKHGGRIDAGFDQHLAEWTQAHPAFPQAAQEGAPTQQRQPAPGRQGGPPPVPQQAPDGKFYIPDPRRPGKYLEVRP